MGTVQTELVEKALPGAIDHEYNWISFALYAPQKKSVHVIGSFNDWAAGKMRSNKENPATGTSLKESFSRWSARSVVKPMPTRQSSCFPANPELTT